MENIYSNNVVIKIHNGTMRSDVNLCLTCRNGMVRTFASGEKQVVCMANYQHPLNMRQNVASCSAYFDKTSPTLDQMEQIAWTLMTDKGGRKLGFEPPERERHSLPVLGF